MPLLVALWTFAQPMAFGLDGFRFAVWAEQRQFAADKPGAAGSLPDLSYDRKGAMAVEAHTAAITGAPVVVSPASYASVWVVGV